MATLHLIPHTHWDREWYLPFQEFRLQLVALIDNLLEILQSDPEFKFFTLDGQTIILDDYLQMRPERAPAIRAYVRSGRLLIGPWHVLPDEFLVSPEATIRNLLQGERTARRLGPKMKVGYIPDPFGHIGQMPQILQGFGIQTACVQRGLSDQPCEFWWQSPDGSRVLMVYLRDGYANASRLPVSNPGDFICEVERLRDSLLPYSATQNILLMYGNDHTQPSKDLCAAIGYAKHHLEADSIRISTLPDYVEAVHKEIIQRSLSIPTVSGELRSPKRHHLLPGVLSTRMWIKQRNHACETLLEKWAEPFSTFAYLLQSLKLLEEPLLEPQQIGVFEHIGDPGPILRQAWRLLMECHPHDSICGCSIDQVHEEMRPRFDQVEQIGERLTLQSLETIAGQVETNFNGKNHDASPEGLPGKAIIVFNPLAGPRTGTVTVRLSMPAEPDTDHDMYEIIDDAGNVLPHRLTGRRDQEIAYLVMEKETALNQLASAQNYQPGGLVVGRVDFEQEGNDLVINASLIKSSHQDPVVLQEALQRVAEAMTDSSIHRFILRASSPLATLQFVAPEIPGYGYRTFWLRGRSSPVSPAPAGSPLEQIENEYLRVRANPEDGTLTLTDKWTGLVYPGLNRFVDGGDCGDEYNYCPPDSDRMISPEVRSIRLEANRVVQTIEVQLCAKVPVSLASNRRARGHETEDLWITTRASLAAGVPRLDFKTRVVNKARDHRLRVHFPAPQVAPEASYDGHFEVVARPLGKQPYDGAWIEQPRPEQPQRSFTDISDGQTGLMVANRGLPEVEVLSVPGDTTPGETSKAGRSMWAPLRGPQKDPGFGIKLGEGSEIALTLLRCVGWLSRGDLSTRKGHAGPAIETPGAQMPGEWDFDYAVIPHAGDWKNAFQDARAFAVPLRAVETGIHAGDLPGEASFIEVTSNEFAISAIKMAEDRRGWIVRGVNLAEEPVAVKLAPWRRFKRGALVNLAEERLVPLRAGSDGGLEFKVKGHEIVTIKLGFSALPQSPGEKER